MKPQLRALSTLALLLATFASPAQSLSWWQRTPQPVVQPSPAQRAVLRLGAQEQVLAFAVSPLEPVVALALRTPEGPRLQTWDLREPEESHDLRLPAGTQISALAFDPQQGQRLLMTVGTGAGWQLAQLAVPAARWAPQTLLKTPLPLADLLVSTRRFSSTREEGLPEHRLYFSAQTPGGPAVLSTRLNGAELYALHGPKPALVQFSPRHWLTGENSEVAVYQGEGAARPLSMHPQGRELALRDGRGCPKLLLHSFDNWAPMQPKEPEQALPAQLPCVGQGSYLPNGLGWMHWVPNRPGVALSLRTGGGMTLLPDKTYLSLPQWSADGRGLVGLTQGAAGLEVHYSPVDWPLADVANAGRAVQSAAALALLQRHDGLLTPGVLPQMHSLYETQQYLERSDDEAIPYLVTTDLFWELFAASYEGLLTLSEDHGAIHAFWAFVAELERSVRADPGLHAEIRGMLATLLALRSGARAHPEAALILAAKDADSTVFAGIRRVDFAGTAPRGYYLRSETAKTYFRALRYLSKAPFSKPALAQLAALPAPVHRAAMRWIQTYRPFLAPARAALVWKGGAAPAPYVQRKAEDPSLFPLAWAFDNEVLDRLVLHTDLPPQEQVNRLLPSGLDLAAVLGQPQALALLEPQLQTVPNYRRKLSELQGLYQGLRGQAALNDGLYHAWLHALATQWRARPDFPGSRGSGSLWAFKRLQTGLASWATLRHATVLVNDQASAQGGEGGPAFEFLTQQAPRGYVEPDPDSFAAIAGLFERALAAFDEIKRAGSSALPKDYREYLQDALATTRRFEQMARKQLAGQTLSDAEFEDIHQVGRSVEHTFLVFKSVLTRQTGPDRPYGIATPEDLPKIADVATAPGNRLHVAVGIPLEWQQLAPHFGRRQLVKGASYAYHELQDPGVFTDPEWREMVKTREPVAWIRPYWLPGTGPTRRLDTTP